MDAIFKVLLLLMLFGLIYDLGRAEDAIYSVRDAIRELKK